MVQKNATPCDGERDSVAAAARDMNLRAPSAAMVEKSSMGEVGANKLGQGALEHVSGRSPTAGRESPGPGARAVAQAGSLAMGAKSFAL
eukprot:9484943-Pyramimonas_sp.AAC.1